MIFQLIGSVLCYMNVLLINQCVFSYVKHESPDLGTCCMQVLVTSFGELEDNVYLDPRTAQVAIVDHVKQVSVCLIQLILVKNEL